MKVIGLLSCFLLSGFHLFGQNEGKTAFGISLEFGSAQTWWRYNRGLGLGWDRSDNVNVPKISGGLFYRYKKWQLAGIVSQEWIGEQSFELFEDTPDFPRRATFSNGALPVTSVEGRITHFIVQKPKYQFGLSVGLGTFFLDSPLPQAEDFGAKYLWNVQIDNHFKINEWLQVIFGLYYEKKHILSRSRSADKQRHEIFSLGLKGGIALTLL